MTAIETKPTTKTNQKTWLDWQHEVLPQLPDPSTDDLLSREEFLNALRSRGADISEGTLSFWEKSGILPRAVRRWRGVPQAFYPFWMVGAVKYVFDARAQDRSLAEIKPKMDARMPMWVMSAVQWRMQEDVVQDAARPAITEYALAMQSSVTKPIGGVRVTLLTDDGDEIGMPWEITINRKPTTNDS